MRHTVGGIAILTVLALSGCVDTEAAPQPPRPSNNSQTIPAALFSDNFIQGLWTNQVEGRNKPLITPKHVVALVGNDIHAWGSHGREAWTHQIPVFDGSAEVSRTLRLVPSIMGDEATTSLVTVEIQSRIEAPYSDDAKNFITYDLETGDTIASSNMLATGVDTPPAP